jgi:hypothetical protein
VQRPEGILLFVLLASLAAHAQAPTTFDLSSLGVAASADNRWVTEATTAVRFADGTGVGPALAVGDRVIVILEDPDKVRIRKDDHYGWVAPTVLSTVAPPEAAGAPQLGHAPALPPLLSQPLVVPQSGAPAPTAPPAPQ